ncbi:MAG: hypothetical protein J0L75_03800 [Spirochaetes bacterium]|nr:hypothetical protein [Spirochaetota bacterium]
MKQPVEAAPGRLRDAPFPAPGCFGGGYSRIAVHALRFLVGWILLGQSSFPASTLIFPGVNGHVEAHQEYHAATRCVCRILKEYGITFIEPGDLFKQVLEGAAVRSNTGLFQLEMGVRRDSESNMVWTRLRGGGRPSLLKETCFQKSASPHQDKIRTDLAIYQHSMMVVLRLLEHEEARRELTDPLCGKEWVPLGPSMAFWLDLDAEGGCAAYVRAELFPMLRARLARGDCHAKRNYVALLSGKKVDDREVLRIVVGAVGFGHLLADKTLLFSKSGGRGVLVEEIGSFFLKNLAMGGDFIYASSIWEAPSVDSYFRRVQLLQSRDVDVQVLAPPVTNQVPWSLAKFKIPPLKPMPDHERYGEFGRISGLAESVFAPSNAWRHFQRYSQMAFTKVGFWRTPRSVGPSDLTWFEPRKKSTAVFEFDLGHAQLFLVTNEGQSTNAAFYLARRDAAPYVVCRPAIQGTNLKPLLNDVYFVDDPMRRESQDGVALDEFQNTRESCEEAPPPEGLFPFVSGCAPKIFSAISGLWDGREETYSMMFLQVAGTNYRYFDIFRVSTCGINYSSLRSQRQIR